MSEINIIMRNPNDSPVIALNGQIIRGVIELNYNYETKTDTFEGMHSFEIRYYDNDSKTIRVASVNRSDNDGLFPNRLEGSN